MLRYIILGVLFYALTPGIFLRLPSGSKKMVALTHAIVFVAAYYAAEKLAEMFRLKKEGFQEVTVGVASPSMSPNSTTLGATTNYVPTDSNAIKFSSMVNNIYGLYSQMMKEQQTNGTDTPLYKSLYDSYKIQYADTLTLGKTLESNGSIPHGSVATLEERNLTYNKLINVPQVGQNAVESTPIDSGVAAATVAAATKMKGDVCPPGMKLGPRGKCFNTREKQQIQNDDEETSKPTSGCPPGTKRTGMLGKCVKTNNPTPAPKPAPKPKAKKSTFSIFNPFTWFS